MNINDIIIYSYPKLLKFCKKNVIEQVQKHQRFNYIEEEDFLQDFVIIWLKKYKVNQFQSLNDGYIQLRIEFLGEKNIYQKKHKENTIYFYPLTSDNFISNDDDFNAI